MNDLLPLLLIGGAAYFFWPQIQSMLGQHAATSGAPLPQTSITTTPIVSTVGPITPAGSATAPTAPVINTTALPAQPIYIPPAPTAPVYQTFTLPSNQYSGTFQSAAPATPAVAAVTNPNAALLSKFSLQQIHSILATNPPGPFADANSWNNQLYILTGITMPEPDPGAGLQSNITLDGGYQTAYWPWAGQQLSAMGFSGLSGLGGWYA